MGIMECEITVATRADVPGILDLQERNLRSNGVRQGARVATLARSDPAPGSLNSSHQTAWPEMVTEGGAPFARPCRARAEWGR